MGFRFEWSKEKTVLRYLAEGDDWNWSDFHNCVRASLFFLHQQDHIVDTLVDFRGSSRKQMPSGLLAHARAFGKKLHPQLSGKAVVIGMPPEAIAALPLGEDRTLPTPDGFVKFVDNDEEARQAILSWRKQKPIDYEN